MTDFMKVKRTLEYRINQTFLVKSDDFDEACEKITDLMESDESSSEGAVQFGVIQLDDELEQIENSQSFTQDDEKLVKDASNIAIDESLSRLVKQSRGSEMLELLEAIASKTKASEVDMESVRNLVQSIHDEIEASKSALSALITCPDESQMENESMGFLVTVADVMNVIHSNNRTTEHKTTPLSELAASVLEDLDFEKIESASLLGDTLDEKKDFANDEIASQLREMGVLTE